MATLPVTGIVLVGKKTRQLATTLESLSWVQEIICYDNNSGVDFARFNTDRITVISNPEPISDFSAVRQSLQQKAGQPWVFFVDSDEVVQVASMTELQKLLENPGLHGLSVLRSDVFLDQALEYGEAGEQSLIRLIRPTYGTWQNPVHEVLHVSGGLAAAPIRIAHYSHDSISEFIGQITEYAQLVAATRTTTPLRNLLELLFFPPGKLFYALVIQGGVLDGWRGVVYACCMSLHSLLVRVYWYEAHSLVAKPRA